MKNRTETATRSALNYLMPCGATVYLIKTLLLRSALATALFLLVASCTGQSANDTNWSQ